MRTNSKNQNNNINFEPRNGCFEICCSKPSNQLTARCLREQQSCTPDFDKCLGQHFIYFLSAPKHCVCVVFCFLVFFIRTAGSH